MKRQVKKLLSVVLCLCLMFSCLVFSASAETKAVKNPLANTYNLLKTEKKLTIGYIGGSITYGSSAIKFDGSIDLSWVNRTSTWFKENYPEATIETVNAGISDTATNFGLFRLEKTLMNEDGHDMPDLVFVEFTSNDTQYTNQTTDDLQRQAESIYLNILKCNPYAEVVIVITARKETSVPRVAYKAISDYYNIPFVDMGIPVQEKITERIGTEKETADTFYYTVDDLHPSWRGYEIYFNEIKNNLLTKYLANKTSEPQALYDYRANLPSQKNDYLISSPKIITANDITINSGFSVVNSAVDANMYGTDYTIDKVKITDDYLKATQNGTITAEFYGSTLGVLFKMTDQGFNISYKIDGGEAKTFKVEKGGNLGWQAYSHAQVFMLEHRLSECKHTVEISCSAVNDNTAINTLIGGLLVNGYNDIDIDNTITDGTLFIKRKLSGDNNTFVVTTTASKGKILKANGLTYTYGGNTYPIVARTGAAKANGAFNSNSESQYTTFEFTVNGNVKGMVVNAEFVDAGTENIAVIGTSVNTEAYRMRFRSRAYRTYVKDGVEYEFVSCGTLLFKQAQDDVAASHKQLKDFGGKNVKCTQLYDRTDKYVEYVCQVNYGSQDSEFLDDDYYAYAYATYKSADGETVTLYSDNVVKHNYLEVSNFVENIS